MNHLQIYNCLVDVASALFGKAEKKKPIDVNSLSPDEAVAGINQLFQMAGAG